MIQDRLNPKLWDPKGNLRSELVQPLGRIANHFKQYVGIDFTVLDTVITGSQAGYNWSTGTSDLDLHLIVDYTSIDCDRELEELFDTKRQIYNRKYSITLRGIPVELYVEDAAQLKLQSQVWSLEQNRWLRRPATPHSITLPAAREIEDLADMWANVIHGAIQSKHLEILTKTQKLLKKFRVFGLKTAGDFSEANMAYKILRNRGLLSKLAQNIDHRISQHLSVK